MARTLLRTLSRLDDLLEVAVVSACRFAFSRRGLALAAITGAAVAFGWGHRAPPEQHLEVGALAPALASAPDPDDALKGMDLDDAQLGAQPVTISVDAIVGRHGDHSALVTYDGRSYRARPGTLIPSEGPPSFVVTRVSCNSVEAYDWVARQTVKASWTPPVKPEVPEVTE